MGLSHHSAIHTAQKHYKETQEDSADFIKFVRTKIAGKDPCDIINMDQTPIPYLFHLNKTLENTGERSFHLHALTLDTKRVTLTVTLDASRSMLPPLLTFKGAQNRCMATREFSTYPIDGQYSCQPKALMDEDAMNKFIDLVLVLWKNTKAPGVIPTLILDACCVHMMGNIVKCIELLGIEVIHIFAGFTYLCQPVDVGINKSINKGMREKWGYWMLNGEGITLSVATKQSRKNGG